MCIRDRGFIGNYGILTLEQGKIQDVLIEDIYKIDTDYLADKYGYPIPYPLGSYLSQRHLHLRDANWWADLPTSAVFIQDFFKFETGRQVDGLLVLDPILIEDILRVLSPIQVPGHDKEITADNVTYEIQYQVHRNIVSMDTRKDFVSNLGEILMDRVMSASGDELKEIIKVLFDNLHERHLQLFANDQTMQQWFCNQRWCGETYATDGDFLQIIDTNISIKKVNFFTSSHYDYQVQIKSDDSLEARLEVHYDNPSNYDGWRGGPYITYVRIYVPYGSELVDASGFFDQVRTYNEYEGKLNQKTVFAGIVRTDVRSKHKVVLNYRLPSAIWAPGLYYSLIFQKQAGTPTIPAQRDVRGYPISFCLKDQTVSYKLEALSDHDSRVENNQLCYESDLTTDREFLIELLP